MTITDYGKYFDKLNNSGIFNADYNLETISLAVENEKIGMQILIARKDSKHIDQHHDCNLIHITNLLGFELNERTKQNKNKVSDPDYKGVNWSVYKPTVLELTNYMQIPYAIPSQIHIDKNIHYIYYFFLFFISYMW